MAVPNQPGLAKCHPNRPHLAETSCHLGLSQNLSTFSRSSSVRWRSGKRRAAPSIPTRRRASTTSPSCFGIRATSSAHGRWSSARWQSWKRRPGASIPTRQSALRTSPSCFGVWATSRVHVRWSSARWRSWKRRAAPRMIPTHRSRWRRLRPVRRTRHRRFLVELSENVRREGGWAYNVAGDLSAVVAQSVNR
jgi:hypothetical protein